jgi:hypothetical protein
MIVTPSPIALLVFRAETAEVDVVAVTFMEPVAIRGILVVVPMVVVPVGAIVITMVVAMIIVVLRESRNWRGNGGQ